MWDSIASFRKVWQRTVTGVLVIFVFNVPRSKRLIDRLFTVSEFDTEDTDHELPGKYGAAEIEIPENPKSAIPAAVPFELAVDSNKNGKIQKRERRHRERNPLLHPSVR